MTSTYSKDERLLVGWNEWCALPTLNVPAIKAKIDTGAKTSAIHAFNIKPYTRHRKQFVAFDIHPVQRNEIISIACHAAVIDQRHVMSSNGQQENRWVILTTLELGSESWDIELTLSNREPLRHRLLLGREALSQRVMIDPGHRQLHGRITKAQLARLYGKKRNDL